MIIAKSQWNEPFWLDTPQGRIYFNEADGTSGDYYIFDADSCTASWEARVTRDSVPQADGDIIHSHWKSGYVISLAVYFFHGSVEHPACDGDLVDMLDKLMLHLNAILRYDDPPGDGRLYWTPTDHDDRILDRLRLLTEPVPHDLGSISGCQWSMLSPFPYALHSSETDTTIAGGATATIDNTGNADTYPVFLVYGPTSSFVITNNTTGMEISYSAAMPGGRSIASGSYAEINTFRNTIYLNGDGANLKPGIIIPSSDFFPLVPGDNSVGIVGANMLVKSNSAWS